MSKNPSPSFAIDPDRLDEEWIAQPDFFHGYAVRAADARREFEEVKQEVEVIKAELDKDIRERPNKFDVEKITEAVVSATVLLQPKYKAAVDKMNAARYQVDIMGAAVTACDHRKKALENLVFLHGQNYFASPRARGEDADKIKEKVKGKARAGSSMTREELEKDG